MKAEELRKSILQAAVQGKLVPQDKNDEPVSELLKRIQQEKAHLVTDGVLKKEKQLPSVTEDEIPYDLPDGWEWCRLNDLCVYIQRGKSPKYSSVKKIPVISQKCIQWDGLSICKAKFIDPDSISSYGEERILRGHDLLWNSTGLGTLGRIAMYEARLNPYNTAVTDSHVTVIRVMSKFVYPQYVLIYFANPTVQSIIEEQASGTTKQKELATSTIKQYCIPLPPFAEQQRIVAKVDELIALCDKLETAENELDALENNLIENLPKSILQAAVQGKLVPQDMNDEPASELLKRIQQEKKAVFIKIGKLKKEKTLPPITEDEIPYDLPDGWEWCRLGQLCQYGITRNVNPLYIPDSAWVLELEDIEKDTGRVLTIRTTPKYKPQSTKHVFEKGDILYSKLRPYLNKVLIAGNDGYCTSEILPLHFSNDINSNYLLCYFRSILFVEYANSCSYGVKMPRLGTNDGRMALLPLPPLAEQQRIVAKVKELMAMCDELKYVGDKLIDSSNVIPLPVHTPDTEPLQMVAQGKVTETQSAKHQAALRDLKKMMDNE